jgi:hypothetical protein
MDAFGAREQAFELAFAHDAEVRFRVLARRNALMAHWAADRLGYAGDSAARFIEQVADALGAPPFGQKTNEERVLAKLALNLTTSGWTFTYDNLSRILAGFEIEAHDAVVGGIAACS